MSQTAIARGLRSILEDHFYFVILAENCIYGDMKTMLTMYPRFIPPKAPDFLQGPIQLIFFSLLICFP